jgi:sulfate permease, SulP family
VVAVNIGVILAMLHFMRRMASSVEVRPTTEEELALESGAMRIPQDVVVYSVEGPFFFGAVENFERALAGTHTDPRVLVIRLRGVPFMDVTGLQTLEEVIRDLQRRGVRVMLAGANARVQGKLEKAGILELIGNDNNFTDIGPALAACQR